MNKRIDVTYTNVATKIAEILREFGDDYVYESCPVNGCAYVHNEETFEDGLKVSEKLIAGCIVGQILHRLGVPLKELETHGSLTNVMRQQLEEEANVHMTDRAFDYMNYAQYFQDYGVASSRDRRFTWGEATQHALAMVNRQEYARLSEARNYAS